MPRVHLSKLSRADLEEIAERIGAFSLTSAQRTIDRVVARFRLLRDHPRIGHPLENIRPGLRALRCGKYQILHRIYPDHVEICRIVHHSRNPSHLKGIDSAT